MRIDVDFYARTYNAIFALFIAPDMKSIATSFNTFAIFAKCTGWKESKEGNGGVIFPMSICLPLSSRLYAGNRRELQHHH